MVEIAETVEGVATGEITTMVMAVETMVAEEDALETDAMIKGIKDIMTLEEIRMNNRSSSSNNSKISQISNSNIVMSNHRCNKEAEVADKD